MKEKGLFDTAGSRGPGQCGSVADKFSCPGCTSQSRANLSILPTKLDSASALNNRICRSVLAGAAKSCVTYLGFVSGERKWNAFSNSDCFCFPTYYHAEKVFGLVAVEAMAFGLPVVTNRAGVRLPEMFPSNYPGLVSIHSPDEVAAALIKLVAQETGESLRENFFERFTG